jgi:pyrimidine-nucleoside phosphorylase
MRIVDLIVKKRDGGEFTREEIDAFVTEFNAGNVPDYQAAAWAMAVYFQGMTDRETADLTLALAHSGDMLDLTGVVPFAVDKHSTGGVGDKTTLVVEPLVAACGVPVGKVSGRGLGYSGGTIDKLESIPGTRGSLTTEEFLSQLKTVGVALTGQSVDLAPADGKLYALRDVTGTVPSIPLVASSVMSKKIAAGAQGIVLDVKVGLGAFMKTLRDATRLARLMVAIGRHAGRKTVALIADMNQPLGVAVGNALEVREALATLRGGGPDDFREHCLTVGAHMLMLAKAERGPRAARARLEAAISDGRGLAKFKALVGAQGGDVSTLDDPDGLPRASLIETVPAPRSAYVARMNAAEVGQASVLLGAGRLKKGDPIDPAVGIEVLHKVGDRVRKGEPLFVVHANDAAKLAEARVRLLGAVAWKRDRVRRLPLFYQTLK